MKAPKKPAENWQPCEGGTLAEVKLVPQADPVRRNMIKGAAVVTGLSCVVGFRLLLDRATRQSNNTTIIPIECDEVLANLDAYIARELEDDSLTRIIDAHLSRCTYCLGQFKHRTMVTPVSAPPVKALPRGKTRGCGGQKKPLNKQSGKIKLERVRQLSRKPSPAVGAEPV